MSTAAVELTRIRPLSHQRTNRKILELVAPMVESGGRVLDVGAGEGFFSQLLGEQLRARGIDPAERIRACDGCPDNFRYDAVPCDPIDASGCFPYDDGAFDAAVSLEVIEHLEHQAGFVRELHRILTPGGRAFISTPNILNINSRLRFLHSGFGLLFDPLPLTSHDPVHTSGHIAPISFYYLAHLMHRAGFTDVRVHFDRYKRSARLLALFLSPFLLPAQAAFRRRLRRKWPAVYEENRELIGAMNSVGMLTARSIIVEGRRAGG